MVSGSPRWRPADPLERALLVAIRSGDHEGYLRLLRDVPLLIPVEQDVAGQAAGGAATGVPRLHCYTSAGAVAASVPDRPVPCVSAPLSELAGRHPEVRWRLVVNPGTSLELAVDPRLAGLLEPDDTDADPRLEPLTGYHGDELPPANAVEEALLSGGVREDPGEAFKLVLLADVVLPVPDDAIPGAGPEDAGFRWRIYRGERGRCIPVFTSLTMCTQRLGAVPTVSVPAVGVLLAWPDPAYTLVVNPGSRRELALSGERVLALRDWVDEVGLAETL